MNAYQTNTETDTCDSVGNLGGLEFLSILGFIIVGASTFLNFTPVVAQNWRASGVGLPVMISCLVGAGLMLRKNYFAGFFIAIFAAFFLTHEIIIVYDNKAVELGQELGVNGWFRPVLMVYQDAFTFQTGAFWALTGIIIALTSICIGWILEIRRANKAAGQHTYKQEIASDYMNSAHITSDISENINSDDFADYFEDTDDEDSNKNNDSEDELT